MGNEVTMGEALVVTVVSMAVVFVVLILISLTINFLKSVGAEKKEAKKQAPAKEEKPIQKEAAVEETPEEDEEELIAIITAAIANSLGVDIPEINIKSIRRTPQATTAWREMGKQEQIMGRL
jgi:sodium pump decarboxylase gamma subunit